ncbi:hypothetical protein [Ectothiorhodospira lacustris]|uniref:hypothetical protein n=1 Tax=Ectothiorhodospira lacustris TaxID=2899127 RepID=UPI001EE936B2|nr:hypothetical protein [Ectothiorhodospira lacustris]MCG5500876.1 hypothetical protein [Ectothiorhodospira lacustris]MCG5511390.1 hypothetical protein [Ectothiorhodospira lacustris]MCG5523209.1 hypothetical protein [Ectothiorhodospira lacustris]
MISLRHRLAEFGFIANEDYSYPVRCLLSARVEHLRCLNIEGTSGRRRAAFAHALGQALAFEHILYHEYTPPRPEAPVRIPVDPDEEGAGEYPADPVDRILGEACARSEGEPALLILDQLHRAPFAEHLRLAEFIRTGFWYAGDLPLKAHPGHLLIFLISDEPLFHSLRQMSFKVWVDPEVQAPALTPEALGLPPQARTLLQALGTLFEALQLHPNLNEYARVIHDIHVNVNDLEDLRHSLYGWVEGVDRERLMSPSMTHVLETQLAVIRHYLHPGEAPADWSADDD